MRYIYKQFKAWYIEQFKDPGQGYWDHHEKHGSTTTAYEAFMAGYDKGHEDGFAEGYGGPGAEN